MYPQTQTTVAFFFWGRKISNFHRRPFSGRVDFKRKKCHSEIVLENTPITTDCCRAETLAFSKLQISPNMNTTKGKSFQCHYILWLYVPVYTFMDEIDQNIRDCLPSCFLAVPEIYFAASHNPSPFLFKSHQESKVVKLNGDFKHGPIFLSCDL